MVLRAVVATLAGALLAAAFPPAGIGLAAILAVALLTVAIRGCGPGRGALLGLLAGLACLLPSLHWLVVVDTAAWLGLALAAAAYVAGLGALTALLVRVPGWPVWVAGAWVVAEAARSRWPLGGLSWARLGFAQSDTALGHLAALGGVPLVTFAVALAGTLLAAAYGVLRTRTSRSPQRTTGLVVAALAATVAVVLAGALIRLPVAGESAGGLPTVRVALVQGNVPGTGLDALGQRRAVLDNHVRATIDLARGVQAGTVAKPDMVLWPENASDLDPFHDAQAYAAIDAATRAIGVPILVGAIASNAAGQLQNVAIVWDPVTGPGATYAKQHLVPFGEFIPARGLIGGLVPDFSRVQADMVPGTEPGRLQLGPVSVADMLCFEVADDGLVRDAVTGGGRLLVVQTNNATYAGTAQPDQQLQITRLRAIEHGRTTVAVSTNGITAVVAADGTVEQQWEPGTARTGVVTVALRDSPTPADRVGAWPEAIIVALTGGAVAVAIAAALRRRRSSPGVKSTGTSPTPAGPSPDASQGAPAPTVPAAAVAPAPTGSAEDPPR
ncbi:MAG: apolipoprotein N-acyltransferase [Actinomycetota bacterium]|nr:MAG: apolipoprotein N-acyltransferase [Actinomycetota bacterium]